MSAAIDALTAGGYGDAWSSGVSGYSDGGGDYFSSALQSLTSLGTGYLSKRLDIDLATRLYGSQPQVRLPTTQNAIGGYGTVVRTNQGSIAQVNLSLIGPLLLVAVVAYFIAKKA